MSWKWFIDITNQPFKPLRMYLGHHRVSAFRGFLISGNLLLLAGLWLLQPIFQQHREYYVWLAGFAATLAMLFIFTILSARINGFRRYRDSWLGFATGTMFVLSAAFTITGLLHP